MLFRSAVAGSADEAAAAVAGSVAASAEADGKHFAQRALLTSSMGEHWLPTDLVAGTSKPKIGSEETSSIGVSLRAREGTRS